MNILNSLEKMSELELDSDNSSNASDSDSDVCEETEIAEIFPPCDEITKHEIDLEKYLLKVAATLENQPNIGVSLSDNSCEVYKLESGQFAKLNSFSGHDDTIVDLKFSSENSNLLYTASNDGFIKLWDLRTPKKSVIQFRDTTAANEEQKSFASFDISPNNKLLAAGTNLYEGNAFLLFWDIRKNSLLGAYWESHTDDITQVKFHQEDSNKLISGSTDGLINLYNLSESSEDDALLDSLNTESSVEKLSWLDLDGSEVISCITHTADVQFWKLEDAQPYLHLHRGEIAKSIKRKTEDFIYAVDVHNVSNTAFILSGSNFGDGECLRGCNVINNHLNPVAGFPQNPQRVRCSWYNPNTNLLLSGGEKGVLNAWDLKIGENHVPLKKRKN